MQQSQPRKAAPQVAAAKPVAPQSAPQKEQTATTVSQPATSQSTVSPTPQAKMPKTNLKAIGFSWNKIRNKTKPNKINTVTADIEHAVSHRRSWSYNGWRCATECHSNIVPLPHE